MPNFIALGIYFIFGTKLSWDKEIDNVECVLLDRNFDFLGGYLVVTARHVVVTAGCCSVLGGYWWLLLVTGGYCSLPLVTARSHFKYERLLTASVMLTNQSTRNGKRKERAIAFVIHKQNSIEFTCCVGVSFKQSTPA